MAYISLAYPPGIARYGTALQSAGRWYDANLVRFSDGAIAPVGGWRTRSADAVTGAPRAALSWRANDFKRYLAVGTHSHLFVYEGGLNRFDITPAGFTTGRVDAVADIGYGTSTYGFFAYGTARPSTSSTGILPATVWDLDTWGEYLVGCSPDDGKLYEWQLNTANPAAQITNAPVDCTGVIVTAERIMFALGADGNRRRIRWSDQENNTIWTPSSTNQAGDFDLSTPGTIQCARRVRAGTLILTDTDAWLATYQGPPFVYGFDKVGTGCGIVGRGAIVAAETYAAWMGESGFWIYDGYTKPLPCEVADYVFSDINREQMSKVTAHINARFGEIWWHYPSLDSTEVDRYVAWNYRENHWTIGSLGRTVGDDSGVFQNPTMVGSDGVVYEHEVTFNYDGEVPFLEGGPLQIGLGERVFMARQLVPDEKSQGQVQARIYSRFYPNGPETAFGPYQMGLPSDIRLTGRQVRVRYEGVSGADWRIGAMRLEGTLGGLR